LSVADKGSSRSASCALNLISTFLDTNDNADVPDTNFYLYGPTFFLRSG